MCVKTLLNPNNGVMEITKTEYYFSTKILIGGFVFIVISTSIFIAFFLKIYKENRPYAFISALPLLVIVIMLPKYIRFAYLAITNHPALILTKESLINNMSGKIYHWSQIKSISYERITGYKSGSGGYILVAMQDSE